jgi:biotin carboxyl carrier protein
VITLVAHVERDAGGTVRILAPAVGRWVDLPPAAALVGAGTRLGRLVTLNRSRELVMPAGVSGLIEGISAAREVDVEFHEPLFTVREVGVDEAEGEQESRAASGGADLPDGAFAVTAPTDGVFYSRPSPDAPPFVAVGATVRAGEAVGLVEVMKTFNQIAYGGAGLPEQAKVVEVRCADGEEIHAGQLLVVVAPA